MFILNCVCGNEVFGDEEDNATAWQCEECGRWLDYFGNEVDKPRYDTIFENRYAPSDDNES